MPLLLAVAASLLLAPQEPRPITRAFKFNGKDVTVTIPMLPGEPPTAPFVSAKDFDYLVVDGKLSGKAKPGIWAEVARLYRPAQASVDADSIPWHTKIVVFTRSNIIDVSTSGLMQERRVTTNDELMDKLQQGIGQFVMLAEAYGRGKIKVDLDLAFENETMPFYSDGGDRPWGEKFARWYFEPRLNSGGFKSDDSLYRGPYQSVFYVTTALTEGPENPIAINGSPVSGISFFRNAHSAEEGGLALALNDQWIKQCAWLANEAGFPSIKGVGATVDSVVPIGAWPTLANPSSYATNRTRTTAQPIDWTDSSKDPLTALPTVESGETTMPFETMPAAVALSRDALNVTGITFRNGQNCFVVSAPFELPIATPPAPVVDPKEVATVEGLPHSPNVTAALALDGNKPVIRYQEDGQARYGQATLIEIPPATEALEFEVQSDTEEPLGINILNANRAALKTFVLGRVDPYPREVAPKTLPTHLDFAPDKQWHKLVVNFSDVGGARYLQVAPPEATSYFERSQIDPIVYQFRSFQGSDAPTTAAPSGLKPDANSKSITERAMAAQQVKIDDPAFARLLDDPERMVVLNAMNRLIKEPSSRFETQMMKRANDVDPAVAMAALEAMDALKNPASIAYKRHILEASPFEFNRAMAATVLARSGVYTLSGPISRLIASKSAYARYLGADAIAKLGSDEDTQVILMVFLQEENPATRLAVTRQANPKIELVSRRLQWSAVNDPSDAVRAASFAKLLQSGQEKYIAEGRKWIHDPSREVKIEVLSSITLLKLASESASVLSALSDPEPWVRVQAIRAAKACGVAFGPEIFALEKDPRVLDALKK